MTDIISKEKRSWNMSRIRSRDTKPEIKVRSMLHNAGYRFRVDVKKFPGRPDIVLSKYKTIIFIHGCFWHRHKNCKYAYNPKSRIQFWKNKFESNIRRDKINILLLKKSEWKVFIVWECEIEKKTKKIIANLKKKYFIS